VIEIPLPHWRQTVSKMDNFHEVERVEDFQALMKADLERVSALNFWASWADPCKSMNEVFFELAKKYPKVLFLQVSSKLFGSPFGTETAP